MPKMSKMLTGTHWPARHRNLGQRSSGQIPMGRHVGQHIARWPVVRENQAAELAELPSRFLYEGRCSGQGERVDWARAAGFASKGEMVLAWGLHEGNVAAAIREVQPWGVDVSSAVESSPGVKDPQKIFRFIAAARSAENHEGLS